MVNKRYFGYEFDEQDGDDTYFYEPNKILIEKPKFLYRVAKSLIAEF